MTSTAQTRWLHTFLITGEMLVLGWLVATEDLSRIAKDMPRQAFVAAASEKAFRRSAEQLRAKFGQQV